MNGNIPIPIFRNLAAELTLGLGRDTDFRIAAFSEDLLRNLPAPVYPFPVDLALAKKARRSLKKIAQRVIGRTTARSTTSARISAGRGSLAIIIAKKRPRQFHEDLSADESRRDAALGGRIAPCAKFEGVSLENRADVSMADPAGMRAITRFRLAACGRKRPICTMAQCRRSIISSFRASARLSSSRAGSDYDKKLVGFSWEVPQTLMRDEGYRFDTTAFPALSNKGHDKDVVEDGKKT